MFKGVIIKISGEELAGNDAEKRYDDGVVGKITDDIIKVYKSGVKTALVVGGGNIWRGRDAKPEMDKTRADGIGMFATIMNALYLADTFGRGGVKASVMTPFAAGPFAETFSKERAEKRIADGEILIFAGGTGHPFFSTDTIAAIRGAELYMDAVLYAKPVDGVYDRDPHKYATAVKYTRLTYDKIIADSKNIKAVDISAACILRDQRLKSVVFKLSAENSIYTAASGDENEILKIGTIIE